MLEILGVGLLCVVVALLAGRRLQACHRAQTRAVDADWHPVEKPSPIDHSRRLR